MPVCRHQDGWLSVDLWAEVLCYLRPQTHTGQEYADAEKEQIVAERHQRFHQLRLTCKLFNQVFLRNQELSSRLYIKANFQHSALSSLLPWSYRYKGSVHTFTASCGSPCAEVALAGLYGAKLTSVVIRDAASCTISTLAAFTSVTICDLHTSGNLVLTPLKALQNLRDLVLRHGTFELGTITAGLTRLYLSVADATFEPDCNFVSTLHCLRMHTSSLSGLHAMGLSACSALRSLILTDAEIDASAEAEGLNFTQEQAARLPSGVSALTHLTYLCFDIQVLVLYPVEGYFDMHRFYTLTNLQFLSLHVQYGRVDFVLCDAIKQLSKLETLTLTADEHVLSIMILNVQWQLMSNLQVVNLHARAFCFESNVLGFTQLTHLKRVCFLGRRCIDDSSARYFGEMLSNMASHRPDVVCRTSLFVDPYLCSLVSAEVVSKFIIL